MELLERIISRTNMNRAFKQVMLNKGSGGVDGVEIEGFKDQVKVDWPRIKAEIAQGNYEPKPVRRVEIPKPDGGTRLLGIPTLMDRMIQQAISQELMWMYDSTFSKSSYGFRPGRNAQHALLQARAYVNEGHSHIVDVDMAKFFDRVNHDYLMNLLSERIKDKLVLKLIHRYLKAGVMINGLATVNTEGTPQGGPLAPRTHPQTLSFFGGYQLKGVDFKFGCFIKGSIFMINGKISELGTGQAHQQGICFITKREVSFSDSGTFNGDVWGITNPGLSLYSASRRDQWQDANSRDFCSIYSQTSTDTDQSDKEICKVKRDDDQQSGPNCAGRIFSKERSWQKRRNKLKFHLLMIVCGSKNSLRSIISLSQTTLLSQLKIPFLN
jgi:hypothetical protein